MELQLDTADLADLISYVAATAPKSPSSPILASVVLDAGVDGAFSASTFDYEVSAVARGMATVTRPGRVLVSARMLSEIVKVLPKGKGVTFSDDGTRVTIKCGSATFTLQMMPAAEYPTLPELPALAGSIGSDALAAAIGQVATAAGKDDTLPALTGVRIEFHGDTLTLVATDRYRLAVRELSWNPARTTDLEDTAILVSARLLTSATRALTSGAETQVFFNNDGAASLLGFSGPGKHTTTRLLGGEYPRYAPLLPSEFAATAEVDAAAFAEAVKRVALVADKNPVRLTLEEGKLLLEAGADDTAQASEEIGALFEGGHGEPFRISFNHDYLLDGITSVGSDTVRLSLTSTTKPAVITTKHDGAPDYRYVIMPIRSAG